MTTTMTTTSTPTFTLDLHIKTNEKSTPFYLEAEEGFPIKELTEHIANLFSLKMPGDRKAIEVFFSGRFTKMEFFSKDNNTSYVIEVAKGRRPISINPFNSNFEMPSENSNSFVEYTSEGLTKSSRQGLTRSCCFGGILYYPPNVPDRNFFYKDLVCKALFGSESINEISALTRKDKILATRVSNLK